MRMNDWSSDVCLSVLAVRADQVAGQGAFGAVPVCLGTLVIAVIAMAFAVPVGLLSAVYLAEYSGPRFRTSVKPVLEVLAGIPTVVYGFFAVLTVAPAMRSFGAAIGLEIGSAHVCTPVTNAHLVCILLFYNNII